MQRPSRTQPVSDSVVKLNVGGTRFWTTRETLLWLPDTFFTRLLSPEYCNAIDEEGAIFIDRDPIPFRFILGFLRTHKFNPDDVISSVSLTALRDESEFYNITPMIEKVDFALGVPNHSCGGILYSGALYPIQDFKGDEPLTADVSIRCIAGDHNWVAIAFARRVVCYSFQESFGWVQRFVSPVVSADIEHVALNNKYGEQGAKMVGAAFGTTVRLWSCSENPRDLRQTSSPDMSPPNVNPTATSPLAIATAAAAVAQSGTLRRHGGDTFDLGRPVDAMFFIGSSLVTTATTGRVGVWNAITKTWQVRDVAPIGCYDYAGSLLFLGSTTGNISYIDMEKFPLRLKDDSLLVNDFWSDPKGENITALSVYMTAMPQVGDENCIEIAYGTTTGVIRIVIQHPQSGGHFPVLFQTYNVHHAPIQSITLSEKSLISVCKNDNHARTWKITRFRGRISTQPGSIPMASFSIAPSGHLDTIGPFGDRDQAQLFLQTVSFEPSRTIVLDASTGKRICTIRSLDGSAVTCYCVNESDFPSRLGARSRRFLLSGHENGVVEIWDLTTAVEFFSERNVEIKRMNRKPALILGSDIDHSFHQDGSA